MINPQELRIGNLVYGENGLSCKIRKYDFEHTNFDKLYPITLTPTILEKLGGKAFGDGDYIFEIEKCGIIIWANDGSIAIGDKSDSLLFATDVVCKYVHEWQNLIYSLTKKELQIDSII